MPPETSPSPVSSTDRQMRRRRYAVIGAAVVLCLLLLAVVMNIEDPAAQTAQDDAADEYEELIEPEALTPAEVDELVQGGLRDAEVEVGEGAWIQSTRNGRLAQQYRFQRMEPNPDGTYTMERPEAELFLSGGRVLNLVGASALVETSERQLVAGTMKGGVIIRVFEPVDGQPARRSPTIVVHTESAEFDNMTGMVRCDGEVEIQTTQARVRGRGLRLHLNDRENVAEWVVMNPVYEVRFALGALQAGTRGGAETTPAAPVREPVADAGRAAAQAEPGRSSTETTGAHFYRLTLHENVQIRQGTGEQMRLAHGDELSIVFSTRTRGLTEFIGSADAPEAVLASMTPATPATRSIGELMYGLALAATAPQDERSIAPPPRDDDVVIICDGGLTMQPIRDPAEQPASADTARLELVGAPVRIDDAATDVHATCGRLLYDVARTRLELIETDDHPVQIDAPGTHVLGSLAWFTQRERRGGFQGAGSMVQEGPERIDIADQDTPPLVEDLSISWTEGVEMGFNERADDTEQIGRLRDARFTGNVEVASEDFRLNADDMLVVFDPEGGENDIRSIFASGSVRVRSLNPVEPGTLTSQTLELTLTRSATGRTMPEELTATGAVFASSPEQSIWADSVHVAFMASTEAPEDAVPAAPGEAEGGRLADRLAGVEVRTFVAQDDVQVLLERGTRIFADRLEGDGITRRLVVLGENIRIFDGRNVFSGARHLVLDDTEKVGRVPGAGQFRVFSRPILPTQDPDVPPTKIEPPTIDQRADMRIHWGRSMVFDSTFNAGSGSIDFRGDVDARIVPSPFERQSMTARALFLEFQEEEEAAADAPSPDEHVEQATSPGAEKDEVAERTVALLIARGGAKLENITWTTEDHSDDPRVFYVAGEHIAYDDRTSEALAMGEGELLIHDPRPAPASADESPAVNPGGSSLFRWTRRLHMAPEIDEVFTIDLTGEVEMRHQDPDGRIVTLSSDRLISRVYRPEHRPASATESEMDFGGHAELRRVRGLGNVFIRTETRDIACDEFDYDVGKSIAEIRAKPGQNVSVKTRGVARGIRAEQALWDMKRDSITIRGASGGS